VLDIPIHVLILGDIHTPKKLDLQNIVDGSARKRSYLYADLPFVWTKQKLLLYDLWEKGLPLSFFFLLSTSAC